MQIDWLTFTAQIINFVVLLYLLNHFLYGPVTKAMEEREKTIHDELESAKNEQNQAANEAETFRQKSAELANQKNTLLDQARTESEELRKQLVEKARDEVQSRRQQWLQSLSRAKDNLVMNVRQRTSQQAVAIARNAISQLANAELEQQTFEVFVHRLEQSPTIQLDRSDSAEPVDAKVQSAFQMPDIWKEKIEKVILQKYGIEKIDFEIVSGLICGIELRLGGNKIGRSVDEYLESLTEQLHLAVEKEVGSASSTSKHSETAK